MGTTITVSDRVYDRLDEIKESRDHQTYDSALREVLRDAGHDV
jgi:predicted CopG family antitoxin